MIREQFLEAVKSRLAAIEEEAKNVWEAGQVCPWCWGTCECDGGWSAASRLRFLEEEEAKLKELLC